MIEVQVFYDVLLEDFNFDNFDCILPPWIRLYRIDLKDNGNKSKVIYLYIYFLIHIF
jgi:hypothetical protein